VVFQGKRDYYQLPLALADEGALSRLYTDVYCPDQLARVIRRVPGRTSERLRGRRVDGLPSRLVRSSVVAQAVAVTALRRLGRDAKDAFDKLEFDLGRKAGRDVSRHTNGAIAYSYSWTGFLSGLDAGGRKPDPTILFQVHPMPRQVRKILRRERLAHPEFNPPLREEERLSEGEVERFENSVRRADAAIAASSFVARGLEDAGVPHERIHVVPYGADFTPRLAPDVEPARRRGGGQRAPLRLLWVGDLVFRKGCHDLLEVLRHFDPSEVTLTMVCRRIPDRDFLPALPPNVTIRGIVSDAELAALYRSHDMFAMPSLVEGFGLVYLEAMGMGLPVLSTYNTGCPDVMESGREGVLVKAGDRTALAKALSALISDGAALDEMAENATRTAARLTWRRFRAGIVDAVARIERDEPSPGADEPAPAPSA
jgi:glycosyltransferase involved in cell wall biosynthesis